MTFATVSAKFSGQPVVLLELVLDDAHRYYASVDVSTPTVLYEGKVLSYGTTYRTIGDTYGGYEVSDITVILSDADRHWRKLLAGANYILHRAANLKVGFVGMGLDDFRLIFSGTIESYEFVTPLQFKVTLKDTLERYATLVPLAKIRTTVFPLASSGIVGMAEPIIYGCVTSQNDSDDGAIPCALVNTETFTYLVAAHVCESVDSVYVGGVRKTTGYTISTSTIGSTTYTLITFVADQAGAVVTCDVKGKKIDGVFSENPITILQDILVTAGVASGSIDASFTTAAAVADTRLLKAGGVLMEQQTLRNIVEEFGICFALDIWVNIAGKIACKFLTYSLSTTYPEYTAQHDILGGLTIETQTDKIVNLVQYDYAYHYARNYYAHQRDINNVMSETNLLMEYRTVLNLPWVRERSTAFIAASKFLRDHTYPPMWIRFSMPLHALNMELADIITITHFEGLATDGNGWDKKTFQVRSIGFDIDQMKCDILAVEVVFGVNGEPIYNPYILGDNTALHDTWVGASAADRVYGYLCDSDTGVFSDSVAGKELL